MISASGIQWGNVASWTGSVLTGTSLILAFSIIRRDRQKDESEQARRIIISMRHLMSSGRVNSDDLTVWVENASDRPIRLVTLIAEGRKPKDVIKDLKQAGVDQQELIAKLEKTETINPVLHEGWLRKSGDPDDSIDELRPGERRAFVLKFTEFPAICYKPDFSFTDANGVYWRNYLYEKRIKSAYQFEPQYFLRTKRWINRHFKTRL